MNIAVLDGKLLSLLELLQIQYLQSEFFLAFSALALVYGWVSACADRSSHLILFVQVVLLELFQSLEPLVFCVLGFKE